MPLQTFSVEGGEYNKMLFTTYLFWYKSVFMLQLLAFELLFMFRLKRRSRFALRLLVGASVCLGVSFAFPVGEYSFNALYCSFMFLSMFAVSVGVLHFVFDDKFSNILFCALAGYTIQHIAQETYEIIAILINPSGNSILDFYGSGIIDFEILSQNYLHVMLYVFTYLIIYVVMYWLACILFAARIKKYNILSLKTKTMIILVAFIVLVDVVFSSVITYMVPRENNFVALLLLHTYNVACCVLAVILLFELPRRKYLENEYAVTQNLLRRAGEKYSTTKQTMELINIKCHDMKHQIRQLAEQSNLNTGAAKEMEDLINIYDATYKTENEAFNIILMEKSLLCQKLNVTLSCIADGSQLSIMNDADIYSLFGNLLDNAIEAVTPLNEDKRSIGLSVKSINSFLMINIYNNYSGQIEFEGGLPRTTKGDIGVHGYGFKSVKHIVENYCGELTVSSGGGVFEVNIVLPIK